MAIDTDVVGKGLLDTQDLSAEDHKPDIRGALPGPLGEEIVKRDDAVVSPSYTRSYPFVMDHGKDCMVWDVDGNRFIDFTAGVAVLATGHAHPQIVKAIQEQAEKFIHMAGTDFYLPNAVELAETLCRITPGDFDKQVFFTNSGTESIEAAMKLCRHHTGRPALISFLGAFHGRTYGSMSLSSSKYLHRTGYQPLVAGIYHAPYPNSYRPPFDVPTEKLGRACVDYIEKTMFRHLVSPHEVAGIFVETIQGEGGYVVPPDDFYPALRDLCDRHEIPLVVDEVQSGMGRTGKMFAIEHWGVEPDVVCIAKGIASGMPMGAIVARKSMMTWPSGAHANTYGGNALAVAAALTTIRLLEEGLMENAIRVGNHMRERLNTWVHRYPFVGEVRGKGLMLGAEIVSDRAARTGDPTLRDRIVDESFKSGLLLLGAGPSTIRFCPPLTLDKDTADAGLDVMEDVMDAL
ncbi:MAG TPA: acetyl ornithine aminotransferase family protein [Chloroflexia bacterium]|nr:acetyl ornithine aminotransferase family protein [Chloroflexia bacterium]